MSYDIFTGMLKMLDDFSLSTTSETNFSYDHDHPKLIELKDRYNIENIAGNGNDELSQTLNLLNWLSGKTFHKGDYDGHVPHNSLDLLDYALDNGVEAGINCSALATILTECCLAIGLKARTVYIMPFSPYEADNHVISIVYIRNLHKWIMVDPSFNCYMMDENDTILSPWEARQQLAEQRPIKLNKEFNYNGDYTGEKYGETPESYIEYMAKDLFYFRCAEKSTFDANAEKMLTVSPAGYDVKKALITNIEYRIKKYGDNERVQYWLAKSNEEEINYISLSEFLKRP